MTLTALKDTSLGIELDADNRAGLLRLISEQSSVYYLARRRPGDERGVSVLYEVEKSGVVDAKIQAEVVLRNVKEFLATVRVNT